MPLSTPKSNSSSRRSSVYNSFQDMLSAGGQNSLQNFASSYSRSANFIQADFDVNAERPRTVEIGLPYNEQSSLIDNASATLHPYDPRLVIEEEEEEESDVMSIRTAVLKESGSSTAPQTVFNGINTLIGIGILSLPLGLHYAGWVCGTVILAGCALSTQYTAKILARCLDVDSELQTYGDIAHYSFGKLAYTVTVCIFSIDLLSAGTSMIIIFADSFHALTGVEKFIFKAVISLMFFLSSFLELRILSRLSLVGIVSTTLIVFTVLFCGFRKTESPGSLLDVSPTQLWPQDISSLFLSIGIFMSPFGGHAIFPELYRDMQHPYKYNKACTTIFSVTWLIDYVMASLGYLMFGALITDQVTKSIMVQDGFPGWVKVVICALMGILPISKGPLILRPIITLIDQFTLKKTGLSSTSSHSKHNFDSFVKLLNRLGAVTVFFVTSLVFTDFGKIMSFLGSAICFAVCIIFPLAFYLKLHHVQLSLLRKAVYVSAIVVSTLLAICGTVAVAVA